MNSPLVRQLGNYQHFKDLVSCKQTFLVLVYMESCSPCKRLKPALVQKAQHANLPIYMISKTQSSQLVTRLEVQKVPHVSIIKDGDIRGYIQNSDIETTWPFVEERLQDFSITEHF